MGRLLRCVCMCVSHLGWGWGQNEGYKVVLMCSSKHYEAADRLKPTHADAHSYRHLQTALGAPTAAKVWKCYLRSRFTHTVLFTAVSYFQLFGSDFLPFSPLVSWFSLALTKTGIFYRSVLFFNAEMGSHTHIHTNRPFHLNHMHIKTLIEQ